jgi:hypothetical protein
MSERMWLILSSSFSLMLVFLMTFLAILPSILRSRASGELENLALRHIVGDELQCDVAVQPRIFGLVDHTHSAPASFLMMR